jgi:hypothetical protein
MSAKELGVGVYLRSVLSNVKTYLTGGLPIAALFVADRVLHVAVPRWAEILVGVVAVLVAPYAAWRKEHEARLAAEDELRTARAQDPLAPHTKPDELWLLAATMMHGLHRELHASRSGSANSFWIGQTPIDYNESRWLYDLIAAVTTRGLIRPEKNEIYHLTPAGERALAAGRKRGRLPDPPATLIGARSGQAETFPLD